MSELTRERLEQLRALTKERRARWYREAIRDTAIEGVKLHHNNNAHRLRITLDALDAMERERDEALAEVERLQTDVDAAVDRGYPHDDVLGESWRRLRQDRDEAREERQALREWLAMGGNLEELDRYRSRELAVWDRVYAEVEEE